MMFLSNVNISFTDSDIMKIILFIVVFFVLSILLDRRK